MILRDDGCALCGSTWGDYWAEVDGERRFFCCEVCAVQLFNLVGALRREMGASEIRGLSIEGDRRGRTVTVEHDGGRSTFRFVFGGDGEIRRLRPAPGLATEP